jgi:membrane protease YdiL (CAAX protease family)
MLLVWVGALLPWLAWRTSRRLGDGELPLPRAQFFWQTTFLQLILYGIALLAAGTNHTVLRLLPHASWQWWPAAALLVVMVAALKLGWPYRTDRDKQRLGRILPHDPAELLPYFVLCIAAGVAEEVLYRGTAYRLLLRLGANMFVAVALLAIAFAAAHATQGLRSVIAIALIAIGFHAVVIYTNALLPAIVAHTAYDAIAGLLIPRWISGAQSGGAAEREPRP